MKKSIIRGLMAIMLSAVLLLGCGAKKAEDTTEKQEAAAAPTASVESEASTAAPSEAPATEAAVPEIKPEAPTEATEAGTAETGTVAEREVPEGMQELEIGTMGFSIIVPSDYYEGELTEEDIEEEQVAYYKSDEHLMDFDIYQYEKNGKKLDEITMEKVEEYGSKGFETVFPNDLAVKFFYSEEEYEGIKYNLVNYLFESDKYFGEICFWIDGDDAEELIKNIMDSLLWKNQPKNEIKAGVLIEE